MLGAAATIREFGPYVRGKFLPPLGGGSEGKGLKTPYRDKMMNVCDHLKAAETLEITRVGTL